MTQVNLLQENYIEREKKTYLKKKKMSRKNGKKMKRKFHSNTWNTIVDLKVPKTWSDAR